MRKNLWIMGLLAMVLMAGAFTGCDLDQVFDTSTLAVYNMSASEKEGIEGVTITRVETYRPGSSLIVQSGLGYGGDADKPDETPYGYGEVRDVKLVNNGDNYVIVTYVEKDGTSGVATLPSIKLDGNKNKSTTIYLHPNRTLSEKPDQAGTPMESKGVLVVNNTGTYTLSTVIQSSAQLTIKVAALTNGQSVEMQLDPGDYIVKVDRDNTSTDTKTYKVEAGKITTVNYSSSLPSTPVVTPWSGSGTKGLSITIYNMGKGFAVQGDYIGVQLYKGADKETAVEVEGDDAILVIESCNATGENSTPLSDYFDSSVLTANTVYWVLIVEVDSDGDILTPEDDYTFWAKVDLKTTPLTYYYYFDESTTSTLLATTRPTK